jgi:general secretion pathway protein A
MFKEFYGFKKEPFNITPDSDFLYLSASHREALAQLTYGIETKKGFILMTGEVGVGKTTIINALLRQLVKTKVIPAFIFNTKVSRLNFFQLISDELGLHKPHSKAEFLVTLNNFLITCHAKNEGPVVIIIDEAHDLDDELLEEVRLLLNLETAKEKLLQLVLSGQIELWERLKNYNLRQLRQRIVLQYQIKPLNENDTREYIDTRIKFAGGTNNMFEEKALKNIYRYSRGVPRLINVICTHALISGYALGQNSIGPKIIKEVAKDFELPGLVFSPFHWKR